MTANTLSVDWSFCGERLRQARQLRGLSLDDLAKTLGISRRLLVEIEIGFVEPKEEMADRLSLAVDFPAAFFFQEPPPDFPLGSLLLHYGR